MADTKPRVVVFSTLFPSNAQPGAGLFIRERMFRVARLLPLTVVSPVPWFPLQGLIRLFRPHYRAMPPRREVQDGIEVWHPRFFSVPGLFRAWDGFFMALGCFPLMKRLARRYRYDIIDAHFAYPDGYAATLLGRWLRRPVTITLRGTEARHVRHPLLRRRMQAALLAAGHVFAVSDSLRHLALELGVPPQRTQVVGNGVDTARFQPVDRDAARAKFGLSTDAKVLISVGALVERKGMHRVIEVLPALLERHPALHYLIVGGASPEGDNRAELDAQVARLGLADRVHFLGALTPDELKWPLSAADVFVLATRNEGWANVFLEAMACGLPVITTDVGGNAEVVCRPELGRIVPFGDAAALTQALDEALAREWNRQAILDYAQDNQWDKRVAQLLRAFDSLVTMPARHPELAVK